MNSLTDFVKNKNNIVVIIFLSVILSLLYYIFIERSAYVTINLETNTRTIFKIYWKKAEGNWTERKVSPIVIDKDHGTYSFRIADLARIQALRIDPSEHLSETKIKSITIDQNGYEPIVIAGKTGLELLHPHEGIKATTMDDQGLTITPANKDPQLVYTLPALTKRSVLLEQILRITAIFLVVTCAVFLTRQLFSNFQFVPLLLACVFTLAAVMASISTYNQHPDEFIHVAAGQYYQQHWMPPPVGDQTPSDTYSMYGVSRLHSGEIAYLLAGKFARLAQVFQAPGFLSLRYFNVALLLILLLLAVGAQDFRILMLPLLLSPQIWYIFSYFNSEAFAILIMLLTGYQLAAPSSSLNTLLNSTTLPARAWVHMLSLGILAGMLLLLKLNFYFYCLFLAGYFLWRLIFGKTKLTKNNIPRLFLIILIGVVTFAGFRGTEAYINDFHKSERQLEAREQFAQYPFKPSTPLEKKHILLQMKDRGVSLKRFVERERWGEKSFRTAFGVYGYTTLSAPFAYYDHVRYAGLLLLATVVVTLLIRGGKEGIALLGLTTACAAGMIIMAAYHAWTVDFQAQGRYFLPIAGMLAVFFYHVQQHLMRPLFIALFLCLFGLGIYNFLFVGLHGVCKYHFFLNC